MQHPFAFLRTWPFFLLVVVAVAVVWPNDLWEWIKTVGYLPQLVAQMVH